MKIEDHILGAVLDPIRWVSGSADFAHAAAASLDRVFGAPKAVFVDRRRSAPLTRRASPEDVYFINWPSWCKTHYCERFQALDPIRRWLTSAAATHDEDVVCLSDLVSSHRLENSDYFHDMLRPSGARHVMTMRIHDGANIAGLLSLVRDSAAGDFTSAERRLAHALIPALDIAYEVARERAGRRAAANDRSPTLCALTPREQEVVRHVARGHANKEIARLIGTSPWTVKNHLRAIFGKLGVRNRTELCALVTSLAPDDQP